MSNDQPCKMPEPTPNHTRMMESVGIWDVKAKHFMEPGKPPMETTAVETITAVGGFWTVSRYESNIMGAPFVGQATMGYDPEKKVHVSTWVDSMSPMMMRFEGNYDAAGKVITMKAKGPSMMGPGTADWRSVMEHQDKNHLLFKMFVTMPHGEVQIMENAYTRRK